MKLYQVLWSEGYETFGLLKEDWKIIRKYEGVDRIVSEWGIRELRLDEKNRKSDIAYFTDMPYSLLINEEVFNTIGNDLDLEDVELLPTKFELKTYYLLHGIKAYDLNYNISNSKINFDMQELKEKGLEKKALFRIKYRGGAFSDMLFTENFVNIISKNNFKGCEFKIEWDSEGSIK